MSVADVQAWPERLNKVTVEDIQAVARKYLNDDDSVTGILKPAPKFKSSIADKPARAAGKGKS